MTIQFDSGYLIWEMYYDNTLMASKGKTKDIPKSPIGG